MYESLQYSLSGDRTFPGVRQFPRVRALVSCGKVDRLLEFVRSVSSELV